jgi:peroxiredoxin
MTGAYEQLPANLPEPTDDGAAAHLIGVAIPSIRFTATTGLELDLAELAAQRSVLFIYPRTGQPGVALPAGWDEVPGARGCTPETIGFRDHESELGDLGVSVYGFSSQDPAYQAELAERLGTRFPILSDVGLRLAEALTLPTFEIAGMRLYRRLTLVLSAGRVEHVFYPVFPTDTHAAQVLEWVRAHPLAAAGPT